MSNVAIRFDHVTKAYPLYHHMAGGIKAFLFNLPTSLKGIIKDEYVALEDVSFSVHRGETVGFIGRNGAGKSTTLGLIAKVLKPNRGSVQVNGRVSPLLELGGGFHPDLTGRENILMNGVLLGLSRKEVKNKLDEIIEFSELESFIQQPIRTYSSGMLSRLGFSVVAHLNPDILLIDEILAVGDMRFQQKCQKKISEFKDQGVTIVLVSHAIGDMERLCNRLIWIDNHRVKMDGLTADVIPHYLEAMK